MVFVLIPYTSIFGTIAQCVMDQISILIAIYIAKRKFFPAMNSRIIDAFHYNNVRVYLEQKRLLYRYKVLICFLIFTFGIYILKNLSIYNLFVIFDSISVNPCWFHVTYHFPVFSLLESTQHILNQISAYFQILGHDRYCCIFEFQFNQFATNLFNYQKTLQKNALLQQEVSLSLSSILCTLVI